MYSEADVQRLSLLSRAVRSGNRIHSIASLSDTQLLALLERNTAGNTLLAQKSTVEDKAKTFVEQIFADLLQFNTQGLHKTLEKAEVSLGWQGLLQLVLAAAATEIGNRWRVGILTAAHEHFFTSTAKVFLGNLTRQYLTPKSAPRIVITTPRGQIHELGAILAAASAANVGWEVAYLGPNLAAADIVGAAASFGAKAIALSMVYPEDDLSLGAELMHIRKLLPKEIPIICGGRACQPYLPAITAIGATMCENLNDLCNALDQIRRKTPEPAQESNLAPAETTA